MKQSFLMTAASLWLVVSAGVLGAQAAGETRRAPAKPATEAVGSDPQQTTATYGDWVLRCVRVGTGARISRTCEIVQTLEVQGQGTIAQIAFSRPNTRDPVHVTVVLPTNISFPSTVRMAVNDKDSQPAELNWLRCLPGGCIADAAVTDDVLRRWSAQTTRGEIRMTNGAGQDLRIMYSFRGFGQALEALYKA